MAWPGKGRAWSEARRAAVATVEQRLAKATRPSRRPPDARPDLGPCLIYLGADNGNGYGQFRHDGRNTYAHRAAWEMVNGPIPEGLTVDHLCRVRRCVEVSHMELVDGVTNYLRGVATRTHCAKGHPYGATAVAPRRCEVCRAATRLRSDRNSAVARAPAQGYSEARAMVFARCRGRCERCGRALRWANLHAHHRARRAQGRDDSPMNLVATCPPCHGWIHANPWAAAQEGMLLRTGWTPKRTPIRMYDGRWLLRADGTRVSVAEGAPPLYDVDQPQPSEGEES